MPVDLAGAVAGWLVELLGGAGIRLVRGSRDDRLLRKAVKQAIGSVVSQVDPAFKDPLGRLLRECFSAGPAFEPDVSTPIGTLLRSAITAQVAEAESWVNNDTGRPFYEEAPVGPDWLAQQVTDAMIGAMRQVVAEDGLAELVHGVDTADVLERLDAIGLTVGQLAPGPPAAAGEAFENARQEYLDRLRQRFRRIDLAILTPLIEQDEHPEILLRRVFVPQLVRADPPPIELPREVWRRLTAAGEMRDADLPAELEPGALDRLRRTYQDRPARPVLAVVGEAAGRNLVLLGDPGAGKSTLARYLMLALAETGADVAADSRPDWLAGPTGWLPLLVELRAYADPRWRSGTFLDMLSYLHDSEGMGLPRESLAAYLRDGGRALVVFDGLDEIFDPQLREQVTRQIEGFAARYRQVRVVVTSRVIGYQRAILDAAGFSHYMLQDLDMSQVKQFTAAWFRSSCPDNAAEAARLGSRLLTAVEDSAAVAELAGNPMLLTILAIISRRQELPRDRRTVYQHAVSVLVEHWDATGKHLRDERVDGGMPYLRHEDKLELLRLVARRMQDGPAGLSGNYLAGPDLLREFESYLRERFELPADRAIPAAAAMLDQLRERNFILAQFGAGVYGFVHRAFLEYLAAADIGQRFSHRDLDEDELIGIVSRRWADPSWQEVLLLVTGMVSEKFAARVIDSLLDADPLWNLRADPLPRHVLLAFRCLAEVRKPGLLAPQSRAVAGALISVLELAASDLRVTGDRALAETFEKTVLPVLSVLGPHWAGRRRYEDWYLTRGQFQFTRPAYWWWPTLAARIMTNLFPADPATRLLVSRWAAMASSWNVRQAAVMALATRWRMDPDTGRLLRLRATADPQEDVRRAAVQALAAGWREDPSTVIWLRERAITDPQEDVRRAAVQALAAGWPEEPSTVTLLRERATTDIDSQVRQAALPELAAGWREDPGTVALLRERATTDIDWRVRQAAIQELAGGWREDPGIVAWLRERAVTDVHGNVRQTAVEELGGGRREDPSTPPWLRHRAAADPHGDVRRAAVRTLAAGWHDEPRTAPWLRQRATSDTSGYVRLAALEVLGKNWREDPDIVPWLRERATTDSNEYVRIAAEQALVTGWREDPDTGRLLHDLATADPSWRTRSSALLALATAHPEDPAIGQLLRDRTTADPRTDVRETAVVLLAEGWRAEPEIVRLLHDRATASGPAHVRRAALLALAVGWREDPATRQLLRDRAEGDRQGDVRLAALRALAAGWSRDPETAPWLADRAMTDPHVEGRRVAVLALAAGWPEEPLITSLLLDRATGDNSGLVRLAAMQALAAGWRDDPGTRQLLVDRAAKDRHADVRLAAVQALAAAWREDPDTVGLLCDRATTDSDEQVRQAAAEALAMHWPEDPDVARALREYAATSAQAPLRRAAIRALVRYLPGDPDTGRVLRDLAATDSDKLVRQAAEQALVGHWREDPDSQRWLRDRRLISSQRGAPPVTVPELAVQRREDPDTGKRLRDLAAAGSGDAPAAVRALAVGWRDDPDTGPLLRDRAVADESGYVRRAAMEALGAGWRDDPDTGPLLRDRAVSDDTANARLAALELLVLGWRDDPGTGPLLRDRAVADESWYVRRAAVQALEAGWREDPDTRRLLHDRATNEPNEDVRQAAGQAMGA